MLKAFPSGNETLSEVPCEEPGGRPRICRWVSKVTMAGNLRVEHSTGTLFSGGAQLS